jgi:hypothetical protein
MMRQDDSYKSCEESLKLATTLPPRVVIDIIDSHPLFCFRYLDVKFSEMVALEKDYAPFISGATMETITGLEGALDKIRGTN